MTKHITVEVADADEMQLRAAAERDGVSVEAVASEIIRRQINYDSWFAAEVQKGIDSVERGDVISHEEFIADGERIQQELLGKSRKA